MASGAKGEEDIQVQDAPTPLVVQKSVVQAGKEKAFQAALTLVIFQDAEVLRNKSSIRLLPQGSKASNHHGRPRRPGSELDARPSYSFIHPA